MPVPVTFHVHVESQFQRCKDTHFFVTSKLFFEMSHFFSLLWLILVENARFYGWSTTKSPFLWLIRHKNVTLFSGKIHKPLKISNLTPVTLFAEKCHAFFGKIALLRISEAHSCHPFLSHLSHCDMLFGPKMSHFFSQKPHYRHFYCRCHVTNKCHSHFRKVFL